MRIIACICVLFAFLSTLTGCQEKSSSTTIPQTSALSSSHPAPTQTITPTQSLAPNPSEQTKPGDALPTLSHERQALIEMAWELTRDSYGYQASRFMQWDYRTGAHINGIRYYGTYILGEGNDRKAYDVLYIPAKNLDVPAMLELFGYSFVSRCAFHLYAFEFYINDDGSEHRASFERLEVLLYQNRDDAEEIVSQIRQMHNAYETKMYGYSWSFVPPVLEEQEQERIQSVWLTCTGEYLSEHNLNSVYYGKFDGYDIFESATFFTRLPQTSQMIGAYTFTETRTVETMMGSETLAYFEIYAIKNGELKTLKEIYDTGYGYISEESLAQIYEIFQQRRNDNNES